MRAGTGEFSLIALALTAPHIGFSVRWPRTLHAITMDGLPMGSWPKGCATSACGKTGLRILAHRDGYPLPWPPRVKGLTKHDRCPECFTATGRPRPKCAVAAPELGEDTP